MDESVRGGDLGDEGEEERDEGVHYYDRPAMETMEARNQKWLAGRVGSRELEGERNPPVFVPQDPLYEEWLMKRKYR